VVHVTCGFWRERQKRPGSILEPAEYLHGAYKGQDLEKTFIRHNGRNISLTCVISINPSLYNVPMGQPMTVSSSVK
jgi:hypothetical protein